MLLHNRSTLYMLLKHIKIIWGFDASNPRFICGLFEERSKSLIDTDTKVTIVGSGKLAAACAVNILTQEISDNVVMIADKNENRLKGEVLDMQQGSLFFSSQIQGTTDYQKTAKSKICVITIGDKAVSTNEQIMELGQKNAESFKKIIPQLVKYSPQTMLLVVSNPVDIMTYTAWKLSALPTHKVFGLGTTLDSARFIQLIAQKLGIPPRTCQAHVIGGHNTHQVPLWSHINFGGDRLRDLNPDCGTDKDKEKWKEVYDGAINSPKEITELKGDTAWAKGLAVGSIVNSILRNTRYIYTVTTYAKNIYCIPHDVFLSFPCIFNSSGLRKIIIQKLNEEEKEQMMKCAENLKKITESLKLS